MEGFLKRFGDGHRLQDEGLGGAHVATVREALAGEGQVVALPDGVVVYLMDGDAVRIVSGDALPAVEQAPAEEAAEQEAAASAAEE